MPCRNATANAESARSELIFRKLLKVNKLREAQLRRQQAGVEQQLRALLTELQGCRLHLAEVTVRLKVLLNWQGTLHSQQLLEKKRKMAELFTQGHKLLALQCQLRDNQQQLENQCSEVQKNLNRLLKKKEKITRVLADECHQS